MGDVIQVWCSTCGRRRGNGHQTGCPAAARIRADLERQFMEASGLTVVNPPFDWAKAIAAPCARCGEPKDSHYAANHDYTEAT